MKSVNYLKQNSVDVDSSIELFGDMEIYNETMQDFLDGISQKLERLASAKNSIDLANYAVFAHSIKSDARYLGFTTVASIALSHEMAGKEGNQKHINDNYEDLLENVNMMINVVTKYLTEEDDNLDNITTFSDKKKILVVDDSELITNLVNKTLKDSYDLILYNKGQEAIDYIINYENSIDIILLDLNMPDINGFEILELLKNNNLFEKIKVSIITGDESAETIASAFTYPIIDMLSKPFSIEDLKKVVEKMLNR